MCSLQRIAWKTISAVVAVSVFTQTSFAQLPPQPELLVRLWPLFRSTRPAVQLPESPPTELNQPRRPLIAPFVPRKLDINSASFSDIQNLPGISSSMAARIFAGRPYRDLDDLRADGIPLNVVQGLSEQVVFGP